MAKVTFPKFGSLEGSSGFILAALLIIGLAAVVGLSIWVGGGDDTPTVTTTTTASPSIDELDDFDDFGFDVFDYGDDPYFDSLQDECSFGTMVSCDELFFVTPMQSDYEWWGATCGGIAEWASGMCVERFG